MADPQAPQQPTKRGDRRLFWPGGLSARLLVLTALFVSLAGMLMLPPALAAFEEQWLLDRVRAAELASLATEVSPDGKVTRQLSNQLLDGAGGSISIPASETNSAVSSSRRADSPPGQKRRRSPRSVGCCGAWGSAMSNPLLHASRLSNETSRRVRGENRMGEYHCPAKRLTISPRVG